MNCQTTVAYPPWPQIARPVRGRSRFADGVLSIFASVRMGEHAKVLLLASSVFLLLGSYYMLKTVREALILSQGGAEIKSYSAAAQTLLLLAIVPLYSRLASKFKGARLIGFVTVFFILNLMGFGLLGATGLRVGVAFFIWVGIFNVTVVAQFWSFANDVYTEEQGKRLMPLVGAGSSLGALGGSKAAGILFAALGAYGTMYAAALVLGVSAALAWLASRQPAATNNERPREAERPDNRGGFRMIFSDRYLMLIAVFVLLLNLVNTAGEFLLGKFVVQQAKSAPNAQQFIGGFYADYFTWVSLLSVLIQLFLVSRIFKHAGVRVALFIVPCIALGGYALLAFVPVLAIVRMAKILENSADYSIQNTARHSLFLTTSRDAKYKAKNAIDTFFWRFGDLLQAGIVLAGSRMSATITQYATLNIVFVVAWIGVAALIYRQGAAPVADAA